MGQIIKSKKKKMRVIFIAFSLAFAIVSMEGSVIVNRKSGASDGDMEQVLRGPEYEVSPWNPQAFAAAVAADMAANAAASSGGSATGDCVDADEGECLWIQKLGHCPIFLAIG